MSAHTRWIAIVGGSGTGFKEALAFDGPSAQMLLGWEPTGDLAP